jgi:DNA-binding GntR family transcriptional regulator
LRHESLASRFEVSTMPVREALMALETEGIVTMIPNRGAFVTQYSAAQLREIYEIRATLEKLATQKAVPRLIRKDMVSLLKTFQAMQRAHNAPTRFTALNSEFHETLYALARQQQLFQLIQSFRSRTRHYLRYYVDDPDRFSAAQIEHRQLLDFVEAGKADEAAHLMYHHVYRVGETIARILEQQES